MHIKDPLALLDIPRQLNDLRTQCSQFVKGVARSMCLAATHLMVFVISHKSRDRKLYTIRNMKIAGENISQLSDVPSKILSVKSL